MRSHECLRPQRHEEGYLSTSLLMPVAQRCKMYKRLGIQQGRGSARQGGLFVGEEHSRNGMSCVTRRPMRFLAQRLANEGKYDH